jgi:hypothetical protein
VYSDRCGGLVEGFCSSMTKAPCRYEIFNEKYKDMRLFFQDILGHEEDNSLHFDYYIVVRMKLFQQVFDQRIQDLPVLNQ